MMNRWKIPLILSAVVGVVLLIVGIRFWEALVIMAAIALIGRFAPDPPPVLFKPTTKRGRSMLIIGMALAVPFALPTLHLLFIFASLGIAAAIDAVAADERIPELKSHLTIYVAPPLLTEGGAVIVAAIPMPEDEWRALDGENLAENDPNNRKRPTLASTDRLFGVRATSTATIIEMFYPENGTFGFDLVPAPDVARPPQLKTERILVGDGGWTDRKKGVTYDWPDVSTIHVAGTRHNEDFARMIRISQVDLMRQYPDERFYAGANVYLPTVEQIETAVAPGAIE